MAGRFAEDFMRRLRAAEASRDAGPLVEVFADDAELSNLARQEPARGRAGAEEFWRDYLSAFKTIRSEFTHTIEGDGGTLLEWESSGELPNGSPIRYRGVSVLEVAGDRVKRFRTYYDSAAFVATPATAEAE
jgi:ketosteroid isomerase-like protein